MSAKIRANIDIDSMSSKLIIIRCVEGAGLAFSGERERMRVPDSTYRGV